jgi:hypothetical protein
MRKIVAFVLSGSLFLLTSTARADDFHLGGCFLGPMDSLHRCDITGAPAVGMAGVAAPILVVGAMVTIAHELNKSQDGELPPGTVTQPNKKPSLTYAPAAAADPYYNREHPPAKPSAAFKFNDTATNVVTAVTAAAVVGAVIATVASGAKGGGKR